MKHFFLTLTLLVSCVIGTATAANTALMPEWANQQVLDSETDFYSVSSGSTLENAKQSALVELSMRLRVQVSGATEVYSKTTNDHTGSNTSNFIETTSKLSTQGLTFNNVKVVRSEQASGNYFVEIKVDKKSFSKGERRNYLIN